jgi:hypothetical protein
MRFCIEAAGGNLYPVVFHAELGECEMLAFARGFRLDNCFCLNTRDRQCIIPDLDEETALHFTLCSTLVGKPQRELDLS